MLCLKWKKKKKNTEYVSATYWYLTIIALLVELFFTPV